jgi:hypothetical protein
LTELSYRQRLVVRNERDLLKRRSATGVVLGCVLAFEGVYRLLFKPGADDRFWTAAAIAGAVILLLTIVIPATMAPFERAMRFVGHWIFKGLLSLLLILVYFLFFVPLGAVLRKRYPTSEWEGTKPNLGKSGWEDKRLERTAAREGEKRRPLLLLPLILLSYFAKERQFVLMPVVLLLVILGLVLLFLQTSAIAPFIYTLF